MKPVERSNEVRQAPAAIVDRLKAVDASSLEQLLKLRQEQRRLEAFRAKAEELKERVAPAVHARVIEDYDKRAAALERQSTPLQAAARAEYRKVRTLIAEVQKTRQSASLEREELEFRHAVGELNDSELAARVKEPLEIVTRCDKDQALLDEQAARFVEALGSDDAPEPEAASASAPAVVLEPADAEADRSQGPKALPGAAVKPAKEPPPPPAPDAGADHTIVVEAATRLVHPDELPALSKGAADAGAPQRSIPAAALLVVDAVAGPHEYRLLAVNGIGRSDENHIQIVKPGISRMHAVVKAVAGGFVIQDLKSQNGTFVNGERTTERRLADGDTIEVGTVQFVFRTPWPAAAAASTAPRQVGKR